MVNKMSPQLSSKREAKYAAPVLILKSWWMVNKITRRLVHRKTHNVFAVAIRGTVTLVWGNLHETLLASTTDGVGVAGTFLHRERCK